MHSHLLFAHMLVQLRAEGLCLFAPERRNEQSGSAGPTKPFRDFSEDGMSFIQCNTEGKVLQKTGNREPLVHNRFCISVEVLYNAVVQQV